MLPSFFAEYTHESCFTLTRCANDCFWPILSSDKGSNWPRVCKKRLTNGISAERVASVLKPLLGPHGQFWSDGLP